LVTLWQSFFRGTVEKEPPVRAAGGRC